MASAEEHAATKVITGQDPVSRASPDGEDGLDWDPEAEFWADPLADDEDQTHTKHEVETLRAYLADDSNDAARWAPRFWSTREDELPLDGFDLRMWHLVRAVIIRLPSKHSRIIDLLLAIHHMDPEAMGWTEEQKKRFPNWREWTNIENMVMWRIRDDRGAIWGWRFGSPSRNVLSCLQRVRTISAFFAAWSGRYTGWTDLTRGVFILRDALERDPPGQDFDDTTTPEKVGRVLDAQMGAGAQYLLQAGEWIYGCQHWPELADILFPRDAEADEGDERCIWHGPPGFSLERWEFWRERLSELREHPHLMDVTRHLIDVSITAMWMAEEEVDEKGKGVYDQPSTSTEQN